MCDWSGIIEVDIEHGGEEYRLVVDVFPYVKDRNRGFRAYESVDPPDTGELEYDVISFVQRDYDYNWNCVHGATAAKNLFGHWKLDTCIEDAIKEKIEEYAE